MGSGSDRKFYIYIYICVCVCVCVRERERERKIAQTMKKDLPKCLILTSLESLNLDMYNE